MHRHVDTLLRREEDRNEERKEGEDVAVLEVGAMIGNEYEGIGRGNHISEHQCESQEKPRMVSLPESNLEQNQDTSSHLRRSVRTSKKPGWIVGLNCCCILSL